MGLDVAGIGSVADLVGGLADRFFPKKMTFEERAVKELELQKIIQDRDNARDTAKRDVMVAEMNQGDNFTKRARPAIVYTGLFVIIVNYVLNPWMTYWALMFFKQQVTLPAINMPEQFWLTWGGVCGLYVLGRSAEKGSAGGVIGKVAGLITGNK